jgi:hypothetical protein
VAERREAAQSRIEFSVVGVALNDDESEQPAVLELGDALRVRARVHSRDGAARPA